MTVITNNTIQPSSGQALTIKDEGGTASITVSTTGEATFAENIKITANKGINFSAYADGTSNPSSNLLNDYEEGTAQVVFRDSESSPNDCAMASGFATIAYTKIGDTVHCSGDIRITSKTGTTSGSNLRVNGLPFLVRNSNPGKSAVTIGVATNLNMAGADSIRAYIEANTNDFLFRINDSTNGDSAMAMSAIDANFIFIFSATYKTDS
jgi:hypothetical protein